MNHKKRHVRQGDIDAFCEYDDCKCDVVNFLSNISDELRSIRQELEWVSHGGKQQYFDKNEMMYITNCPSCKAKMLDSEMPYEFSEFLNDVCDTCHKANNL